MKLTDDELVEIANQGADGSDPNGYRTLYRAGAEDMRERAAKVCETSAHPATLPADETTVEYIAAAIRALGVDDD